jgi:hypothetical protein
MAAAAQPSFMRHGSPLNRRRMFDSGAVSQRLNSLTKKSMKARAFAGRLRRLG